MGVTADQELCKQPSEKRKYGIEFANLLATSETITGITSITSEKVSGDATDLTLSSSGIVDGAATDSKVEFWIESGSTNQRYRVEVLVGTSTGAILEGDGILTVKDK